MPLKSSLKSMLDEVYGLLNRNDQQNNLFEFDDEELSIIAEEGEDNFLEMNRTWLNEDGGDLSFIKIAESQKIQQNFGKSKN